MRLPGRSSTPTALPGRFSSAKVMSLPPGPAIEPGGVRGYPIDMRVKAYEPVWPQPWLLPRDQRLWVALMQFSLGCHERWLAGDGDAWLQAAVDCSDEVVDAQEPDGSWRHGYDYPHTFPLAAGWISAITQGEAASLLVRIWKATGDEKYAEAARRALQPMRVPPSEGGTLRELGGRPFCEEYPTDPPSFVLNGGIFASWGFHDVAVALGDDAVRREWEDRLAGLRDNLHRWDTGWWSRYDLYPHPLPNVASSFYHALHIAQLEAMHVVTGDEAFAAVAARWRRYGGSRPNAVRAFAAKALFRVAVPRGRARPWGALRVMPRGT